jgi:hypothetical protein
LHHHFVFYLTPNPLLQVLVGGGGYAKQPPLDKLHSTHFLAHGAQPCAEPHGFVTVFDWFDLVKIKKLYSYYSKLKFMLLLVGILTLSLSHTHRGAGFHAELYIYIHTFTEKAKHWVGSMQNHTGYTKGTQRPAQKCG